MIGRYKLAASVLKTEFANNEGPGSTDITRHFHPPASSTVEHPVDNRKTVGRHHGGGPFPAIAQ